MKKIRFVALAIAMLMLALAAVSCTSEKVTVNCTVSIEIDGEVYLDKYEYAVTNKVDTPPTVLQAVSEVCTILEYNHGVDEEGLSLTYLTVDGTDYVAGQSADGTYIGYWGCKVDGTEPKTRMGKTPVQEGQNIVISFGKSPMNEATWIEE